MTPTREIDVKVILNVDAITPPLTGIGRYALEIARGISSHAAVSSVRYFSAYRWLAAADSALHANRSIAAIRRHVPAKSLAMLGYFALREAAFALKARRLHDHVLHAPNYLLFEHSGPKVTTVHDLSWLHYPDFHPPERVRIMHARMPRSLEIADAIIVDSRFVGEELAQHFSVDRDRIHVVPLGVDPMFQPRTSSETKARLDQLGLIHGAYLLAVATLEPRKNLDELLDAYLSLPGSLRETYPLIIAGASGWRSDRLATRVAGLEREGCVRRLGFVQERTLHDVLAGARLLAFPSIYEGFGLPPLEAMASGVPVVTSSSSSIPEVTGDAALLVSPGDTDSLRDALEKGLTDGTWRDGAIMRGRRRAGQFGWDRCVDATVGVYRKVSALQ